MTKGERIKNVREKTGYSQIELADKIQVSKQTMYKYENDIITNIPSDKIEEIAKWCQTTPSFLMGWDDDEEFQTLKANRKQFAEKWNIQFYEKKMFNAFSKLSDNNKKKSIEYTDHLLAGQRMEEEVLNAAHERTDIDVTDEIRKQDDAIMDDDSEWE